jgi:hypothetical protein
VIAAELARRVRAREAAAAAVPSRDDIIAAALGDAAGETVSDSDPVPAARHEAEVAGQVGDAIDPGAATIEALAKLGPGASRAEILTATLRLTALFRDPGSRAFHRSVCNEVARGQLPARVPIAAVGSARGSEVRNPVAAFTAHVNRCRAAAEARRAAGAASMDSVAQSSTALRIAATRFWGLSSSTSSAHQPSCAP